MYKSLAAFLTVIFIESHFLTPRVLAGLGDNSERGVHQTAEKPKKRCRNLLYKVGLDVGTMGAVFVGSIWGLTQGADLTGKYLDAPNLGLSIYLDFENVLRNFTTEEQKVLLASNKDVKKIVDLLCDRLSSQHNDSLEMGTFFRPRMASSYFNSNPPANMCRHKAIVLKGVLNHLGIDARIVTGSIETDAGDRGEHVWVHVPSLDKDVDPMNNIIETPENYTKLLKAERHNGLIQWSKSVGIFFR